MLLHMLTVGKSQVLATTLSLLKEHPHKVC